MSEVLVLVDHADGAVRKTTAELLTLARRLGEPSAVFIGTGIDVRARLPEAVRRREGLRARRRRLHRLPRRAEGRGAGAAGRSASPAAVLIPSNAEGKEIAGRLAIKTESGLITDAVDIGRWVAGDDAVGVRRQLHRDGQGHPRHADHHGQAQCRHAGGGRRRRRRRAVRCGLATRPRPRRSSNASRVRRPVVPS